MRFWNRSIEKHERLFLLKTSIFVLYILKISDGLKVWISEKWKINNHVLITQNWQLHFFRIFLINEKIRRCTASSAFFIPLPRHTQPLYHEFILIFSNLFFFVFVNIIISLFSRNNDGKVSPAACPLFWQCKTALMVLCIGLDLTKYPADCLGGAC